MRVAANRYVAGGFALVGVGALVVAPVAPPPAADLAVVSPAVTLTAKSVANIPINLIEALASAPANEVQALHRVADAFASSGSWSVASPVNVWGWDDANPEQMYAVMDALVPFPAFSGPLGRNMDILAAAELPMNAGCAFECPDLISLLKGWFRVPIYPDLINGYTFPTVINPSSGEEVPWSGDTVQFQPGAPFRSFFESLLEEPSGVETVDADEVLTVLPDLLDAIMTISDPTVEGSLWRTRAPFFGADVLVVGLINGVVREVCPFCAPPLPMPETPSLPVDDAPAEPAPAPAARQSVALASIAEPGDSAADALPADDQSATVGPRLGTRKAVADEPDPVKTTKADDDGGAEPAPTGGRRATTRGGLAGVVSSVSDRITGAFSKADKPSKDSDVKADSNSDGGDE